MTGERGPGPGRACAPWTGTRSGWSAGPCYADVARGGISSLRCFSDLVRDRVPVTTSAVGGTTEDRGRGHPLQGSGVCGEGAWSGPGRFLGAYPDQALENFGERDHGQALEGSGGQWPWSGPGKI